MKYFKAIFLFLSQCLLFNVFAQAQFTYEPATGKELRSDLSLKIDFVMENHYFDRIYSSTNIKKLFGADRIYYSTMTQEAAFFKFNVGGNPPLNQWIKNKNNSLIHFKDQEGIISAVYLLNFDDKLKDRFLETLTETIKSNKIVKTFFNELMPIKIAYASTCSTTTSMDVSGIQTLKNGVAPYSLVDGAMDCLMGVLDGIWQSTGGLVQDIGEGLWSLATDPMGFWNSMEEKWKNLKSFLSNFQSEMNKILHSLSKLPTQMKVELICSFIGSIGTDVLIAAVTGGAGSAKVILELKSYLSRLMRLEKFVAAIAKVGKLTESLHPQFLKKLAKGQITEKKLLMIEKYTEADLLGLAKGAAACGL